MNPQAAIRALVAAHWSETKIADRVGVSQSTVNRVKAGKPAKYELGAALIDLAREVVGAGRSPLETVNEAA